MSEIGKDISRRYLARQRTLARLLDRYLDLPFDKRSKSGLDEPMKALAERLIAHPPPMEKKKDSNVWVPRQKGLRTKTLAERRAEFEPVRASIGGTGLNLETDLVPEFTIPHEVRAGDGASLTDGMEWFEQTYKDTIPKPKAVVRQFRRIPMNQWGELINSGITPDLVRFVEWVLDQASVGSCGAEGTAGAAWARGEGSGFLSQGPAQLCAPQPYFLYHLTSGGYDGGSSPRDNIALIQTLGCCTQAIRPRSKGFRAGHTQTELDDAAKHQTNEVVTFPYTDYELLGTFIFNGYPCAAGYSGHWWWMAGILSTTMGLMQNSWGYNWGDNGRQPISFSSLRYLLCAFINVEDASDIIYG